jgi:hypothetical protein
VQKKWSIYCCFVAHVDVDMDTETAALANPFDPMQKKKMMMMMKRTMNFVHLILVVLRVNLRSDGSGGEGCVR